jgi:Domain of unknown function (DUF4355)
MNLEEVKKFLEENKEDAEVKAYLKELSRPTEESVKEFLNTYQGQKVLQPYLDRHFTKSLETWKQNNLEKLIDEEIKKRFPEKTPEQMEIEKLRQEIERERKARAREALVNKALKVADEKALPKGIIDFFIADDEETTLKNLERLEQEYQVAVQKAVDAKFQEYGRQIDQGSSGSTGTIDVAALAQEVSIRK